MLGQVSAQSGASEAGVPTSAYIIIYIYIITYIYIYIEREIYVYIHT